MLPLKTIPPSPSLELLRLVKQDVATLRTSRQSAYRRRKQNCTPPLTRLDDAREEGLEEGLLIALQLITGRLHRESGVYQTGMSTSLIDARLKLQAAEAAYSLADHGASAPLSSATYSAYVQAYKVLEQARAHYNRVARNEAGRSASSPRRT